MPMSPELQRLLDEYVESLPWYKRWPLKAALALDEGPRAGAIGCLVLALIAVVLLLGMNWYASACANGTSPGWACP